MALGLGKEATPNGNCLTSIQSLCHLVVPDGMDLIRFGGRVTYVDLVSSSFVEESLQALGGIRISSRRLLVAAGERPVAI
jgi:hypothetical protein